MNKLRALLLLEDGTIFNGYSFGKTGKTTGEVVFNTSLTGYQEILTDPSYTEQIVVMTYPLIGNYGVNPSDSESSKPFVKGLVVREYSELASNWQSTKSLGQYLEENNIIGITDIDTRKLVRHIRNCGAMRGIISNQIDDLDVLLAQLRATPEMLGQELATQVSCKNKYLWSKESKNNSNIKIIAYDFGIKHNILRSLDRQGFDITVVPAWTSFEEIEQLNPDGIFLSNGPGDPAPLKEIASTIRRLADRYPIFGICLGHQLLSLAFGSKTYKLKFGHRGGNQPVKNLLTGKVEITSHNHGFSVEIDSLPNELEMTHLNLNDQTLEGLQHKHLPVFSVQYHPEAAPGPHDAAYLFEKFSDEVTKYRQSKIESLC
ncbi:MAG: glutamine-hydrolyzing carbamoyl-phosphate synthase small subunit [Blastocatellia bacterium]